MCASRCSTPYEENSPLNSPAESTVSTALSSTARRSSSLSRLPREMSGGGELASITCGRYRGVHDVRMTWSTPEERDRGLRRARAASWVALGAFVLVGVASIVLLTAGRASLWLLLADLLCAFIAVRTTLRIRAINRALRDDADA